MNKKKVLIAISIAIVAVLMVGFVTLEVKTSKSVKEASNETINETITETTSNENNSESKDIIVTDETKDLANETIDAINDDKDVATTEVIESTEEQAEEVTDEGAEEITERDGVIEQEDISYDGDNTGNGMSLLGPYQGLTYYNQGDSRWANMLYTSTGNPIQTMKSSACGPTSAAIVVSSSKGTILPTTMAQLFVDNRYRTANNGTAWAAFPFVADYFNFNEYHVTSNFDTMVNYLRQDKDNDGQSDYFVIASCGSGLWTTGGHYITLVGDNSGTITVYDPYLYAGKFNTASRRPAGVVVSGNSAFVSENSFRRYSNASNYWIFSNDKGNGNNNGNTPTQNSGSSVNYTRYVATQSAPLNVRSYAGGPVISTLSKGTMVQVSEVSGGWSRITSPVGGWVSSGYLSGTTVSIANTSNNTSYTTSTGTSYRLKSATTLYSNANMTGTRYNYLAKTLVRVIRHQTNSVDYVYIPATGRYAYCYKSAFATSTSTASSTSTSNSGTYRRLKYATTLRSNSNMTGYTYNYLAQTQVRVLSYPRSGVAYVKVVKTGRYAYVYTSALR